MTVNDAVVKRIINLLAEKKIPFITVFNKADEVSARENKTMYVVETCIYDSEGTSYSAIAFYISNGVYFEVMIDSISTPFDPEWLFEFDVEKYVPDQNTWTLPRFWSGERKALK